MELFLEPELYCPNTDERGNYVDYCPPILANGIRCPCGTRGQMVYDTRAKWKSHVNCNKHKMWVEELNCSKFNFYKEAIELKNVVQSQQKIIARLERDINNLRSAQMQMQQTTTPAPVVFETADLLDIN